MSIINQEKWDSWVSKNTDPYGKHCVDTARKVMESLDELDESSEFECNKIICQASGELSLAMAGFVAQMVWECHSRGKEFRTKWNADYGVESSAGIVNPAILTIDTKGKQA